MRERPARCSHTTLGKTKMPRTEQSILVVAPRHKVFAFVADYRNTMKYEKHFSRVDLAPGPSRGIGTTVEARGWFRGIPVKAKLRITEFVEDERIVSRSVAGLKSSLEWGFADEQGKTKVRLVASYAFPFPFIPRQVRESVAQEVQTMTTASLRELKRLLENEESGPASEPPAE